MPHSGKSSTINLTTITPQSTLTEINNNFRKIQAQLANLKKDVEPRLQAGEHAYQFLDRYLGHLPPVSRRDAFEYTEEFTINYAQKRISSSTTPPESPEDGDLWLDPSTQPPTFKRWNAETGEWEKLSATTFEELEGMIDKSQLPDRVIDSMKLAIDAVQSENLAPSSVDFENLMDDAVRGAKIAAEAVASIHIQNGAIGNEKLADLAVTAEKIADGAIDLEKISEQAQEYMNQQAREYTDAEISNTRTELLGRISDNETSITQISQQVDEQAGEISSIVNNVSLLENRVSENETAITQNANEIALRATKTEVELLDDRMSQAESQISVLSDEIELKVDVDGIISAINLSEEGITIAGSKIDVLGPANIADAAITEAKIAEAAVGTAAIQDLAVTNAKIANIHADKITSGVIAAERVAIGPLTQFAEGYDPTKIEVGGRNLILDSNNFSNYITFEGATYEYEEGVSVPEWGAEDATSISVSGGDRTIKIYKDILRPSEEGQVYTLSIWIKNTGEYPIRIDANLNNGVTVYPEDSKRATFTVTGNGRNHLQFRFSALSENVDKPLNFIVWRAQAERGTKATDWAPAPEDNPALLWQYEDTVYIDGGNIYANTITSNQIAAGAITANELAANAVTANKIAANAVTANKIQAEAVGAQAIAANAILAKHIAAGEVTANHLAADAVTADAIAAGAILAEHISANSINSSKIATEGLDANVIKTGVLDTDLVAVRSSNSGTYIDSNGILVDSGSFRLRDEITQVESMVRENANMINDHSFEMVKRTDTSFGDAVFQVDRSNMGNYFWWNVQAIDPAYAQIQTTYGTDDMQRAKFGLQAAVLRNVSQAYWYQYVELNSERGTEGPYTISCYFSAFEKTTSDTTCDIVVQAYDFDMNWLDDVGRATAVVNPSEPYVWRRAYATIRNLPQGTAYIRIRINTRGGFALADGVQLVPFDRPIVYEAEEGLWRTLRSAPGYIAPLLTVDQLNALIRILLAGGSEIYRDSSGYLRIRGIAGQHNGSIVINTNTQEVLIYQKGAFRHAFLPNGTKNGGSIEIDGKVVGMSPVDSPQVLIEYIEFDVPLKPDGVKVYLEERYRKAVANFAVFPSNGTVAEKGEDYFIIAGEGTADIRIVGERIEYDGTFWDDMDAYKEEMENAIQIAETGKKNRTLDRRRKGAG